MDFGIAKSLQTESNLTQTGITLGTSAYLAPEQIRGEAIDRRTDVFAMGVLAYELLAYRKPFRGEHLSTVLYKILNETPEPIGTVAQDAPPGLVAAIDRAMAKVPADRYPTMEAFRKDLQAVYREITGASGMFTTASQSNTIRTIRADAGEDLETTLATPSSGVGPIHAGITPPSGALARAPATPDATPTPSSISGARRPLELVNFRDPSAEEVADDQAATLRRTSDTQTEPGVGKTRIAIFGGILALAAVGAGAYLLLRRSPAPAKPVPPPPAAAVVPTPALEFPEPRLGTGEAAAPAPAPAPTMAAAVPTAAPPVAAVELPTPPPAPPKKVKVQFSSVPLATLFVDGRRIGPSIPARTLPLDEGEHTVRFEAKGFPPHERTIRVESGAANRVHYQFPVSMLLIQAPGWAGARVLVDGKYKGSLPDSARLKLPPGDYSVTLSREGSNPVTERITVPEGAPKTWNPPPPSPAAPGGAS
jgi:Protein kinase domain/PEGA domain